MDLTDEDRKVLRIAADEVDYLTAKVYGERGDTGMIQLAMDLREIAERK